jgi:hypothetical protein
MTQPDGRLYRSYKDGQARFNAYLEDYAALSRGLIALYESTFDLRWLGEAAQLTQLMFEQFHDAANGGFFQTGIDHEQLVARRKDFVDNAIPSGNSLAAETLLRLAVFLDKDDYRRESGAHPADDERCHGAPADRFWPAAGRAGRVPGAEPGGGHRRRPGGRDHTGAADGGARALSAAHGGGIGAAGRGEHVAAAAKPRPGGRQTGGLCL